jgi:hypothetical protein
MGETERVRADRSSIVGTPARGAAIHPGSKVLGVDLAADPIHTGVAILTLAARGVSVAIHGGKASDELLVELARDVHVIGVDAPLG